MLLNKNIFLNSKYQYSKTKKTIKKYGAKQGYCSNLMEDVEQDLSKIYNPSI
jgi:hypothetical protein